jgi:uncharacterized protein (TIGR03905 family)
MIYKTQGVCCREIKIDIDNDTIKEVCFINGCDGNLKGISQLVTGMKTDEVIRRVSGITCKNRGTSCPDQLARALKQMRN